MTSAQSNENQQKVCSTECAKVSGVYIELLEYVQVKAKHIADHEQCQQALQTECKKCIQSKYQTEAIVRQMFRYFSAVIGNISKLASITKW